MMISHDAPKIFSLEKQLAPLSDTLNDRCRATISPSDNGTTRASQTK